MARSVVIDSQVYIWAVRGIPTVGIEDLILRSEALIEQLITDKIEIIIPTPVLAEILIPVPLSHVAKEVADIEEMFRIVPFNVAAAIKHAEIMQHYMQRVDRAGFIKLENGEFLHKRKAKFDSMICAIAITQKAECVYTNDPDFLKFASGFIDIRKIPELPKPTPTSGQLSMFDPIKPDTQENETNSFERQIRQLSERSIENKGDIGRRIESSDEENTKLEGFEDGREVEDDSELIEDEEFIEDDFELIEDEESGPVAKDKTKLGNDEENNGLPF